MPLPRVRSARGKPHLRIPEREVLRHCEVRHETEVLVDHSNARCEGVLGRLEGDRFAVHQHLSGVRPIEARNHRTERRLASTVLPEQGVDFAASEAEVDVGVGEYPVERLVHVAEFDRRRSIALRSVRHIGILA